MNHVAANISRASFAATSILVIISVATALFTGQYLWMFVAPALLIFFLAASYPELIFYGLILTIPLSIELQITQTLGTDFPDESIMWTVNSHSAISIFKQER
jgi:4-amino-4-deoxy-L-arabinose transferase-like glycosyltransferase